MHEPQTASPSARQDPPASPENPIIARASRSYRRTRYFVGAVFFATGLLFAWDGWVAWPKKNREIASNEAALETATESGDETAVAELEAKLEELGKPKSDADLLIQKIFFLGLTPGAVLLILNALYRSRGEFRFDGQTIALPDGRMIPINEVTRINNRKWDKKGIAVIEYRMESGGTGKFTLDDFIYDRPPVDRIHAEIGRRLDEIRPGS